MFYLSVGANKLDVIQTAFINTTLFCWSSTVFFCKTIIDLKALDVKRRVYNYNI